MEQKDEQMKLCPHCRKEVSVLAKKCPHCQSDLRNFINRHPLATVFLIVVGVIILISIVGAVSNDASTATNQVTGSSPSVATSPTDPCTNFSKSSATSSISYAELSKDPTSYNGTSVIYSGQVVQIQQAPDRTGVIRLAVTKTSYGWDPNNIIFITYAGGTNAVDDDVVKVYGQLTGSQTYTSQANYQITVPSMNACVINDETQTQSATPTPAAQIVPTTNQTAPVATPTPAPTPVVQESWHTVTTYSDNVTQNTPPFTMQGTEWRVDYSCTNQSPAPTVPGSFYSWVTSVSNGETYAEVDPNACPTSGKTYEYQGVPGQYYLNISTNYAGYTITVEDYY